MTAISVDDFITFCHRTIEAMRDEVATSTTRPSTWRPSCLEPTAAT